MSMSVNNTVYMYYIKDTYKNLLLALFAMKKLSAQNKYIVRKTIQ